MSGDPAHWRGVFNQWQIGLGGHINIQHYAQALDEARRGAALECGLGPAELAARGQTLRPIVERLDFRKELVPGDAAEISGRLSRDAAGLAELNGVLTTRPDSTLAMRHQTSFAPFDLADRQRQPWTEALPASDPLRAMRPMLEPWMPTQVPGNAMLTWKGTVEVRDCDEHGLQSPRSLYDIITRGLWAVQIGFGRHRDSMAETGAAGGVTAIQVRHGRPARMGDLLQVHTALLGFGSTSVRLGHLIRDVTDGVVVARVEYVTAFFDRSTGKKARPDADYAAKLASLRLA